MMTIAKIGATLHPTLRFFDLVVNNRNKELVKEIANGEHPPKGAAILI